MAVVLTAALIIFADGVLSLLLDRDVIGEKDAGPLIGPLMAITVCAVVLWFVLRRLPPTLLFRMVAAFLSAVVAAPLVGAVLYSVGGANFATLPYFFGTQLLSPFVLVAGVIAAVAVGGAELASRYRPAGGEGN